MEVNCPQCGEHVPGENVNIQKCIAKCPNCSSIFPIDGYKPKDQADIPLPKHMTLEASRTMLTISRRWLSKTGCFFVVFCLVWNGIFGMGALVGFSTASSEAVGILLLVFTIPVLAGIVILYITLCFLINRTTITVNRSLLAIRHGPLPWFGNKVIACKEIEQLYAKEVRTRVQGHTGLSRTQIHYELRAVLTRKTTVKLLGRLDDSEQALFIEQEIEKFLGIEDEHVHGEVGEE